MRIEGLHVVLSRMIDALSIQWLGKTVCEGFFILIFSAKERNLVGDWREMCPSCSRFGEQS